MQVLSPDEIEELLSTVNVGWSAIPGQGLVRVFPTVNFAEGLVLLNRIGSIAEEFGQYPDIRMTPNELEVTLVSRDAGGITESDFEMAKELEGLLG